MRTLETILRIIGFAIGGAIIAILGGMLFLSLVSLNFLAGLYFFFYILVFMGLPGMLVGAIVGTSTALQAEHKTKEKATFIPHRTAVWIGVLLPTISVFATVYYLMTNVGQESSVQHGASWTIEPVGTRDCATESIMLVIWDYGRFEYICSQALLTTLQDESAAIIPITYRVTSDFGDVRSFQLIEVNGISISWEEWIWGSSGCGGELPSCGSESNKLLLESSWQD